MTNPIDRLTTLSIDTDRSIAIRCYIIDRDLADLREYMNEYDANATAQIIDSLDRESLTDLALSHSLCPLHLIDYAICFDDDDPDCASIRLIHPSHDT